MTEHDWNSATDPQPMLEFLRGKVSDRKLLLFGCGCCRRLWHLLSDDRSHQAVKATEKYADGIATSLELETAFHANWAFVEEREGRAGLAATAVHSAACSRMNSPTRFEMNTLDNADFASRWAAHAIASPTVTGIQVDDEFHGIVPWESERAAQAALVRCIFGPLPFCRVAPNPACLSSTIASLAQAIYDERAFDRMPILADALEESGCTDESILEHCRSSGEHVRGCWVVDLVLGKE